MPDIKDIPKTIKGRLFYDDTCQFCRESIAQLRPWLAWLGVEPFPFENGAAEPEMRLRWNDGREFGGADAAIFLTSRLWWTRPLHLIARIPCVRKLAHTIYLRVASRRHCLNGACEIPIASKRKRLPLGIAWLLNAALIFLAWASLRRWFPEASPWFAMWTLATAQWLGFKLIAWTRSKSPPHPAFLAWVGMDARAFTQANRNLNALPAPNKTIPAAAFFLVGSVLLFAAFPYLAKSGHPILAGWATMLGLIATLHLGIFALMARGWNHFGFPAAPIMREPWLADGLADFWSTRWNRAFSDIARIGVFRPLVRRFGIITGTLGGFLLSGIAHEIVISLPSDAGWGMPTLYFLIQGLGVIAERRLFTKNRGFLPRRLFAWLLILGPAPLLFHVPFLETVITPGFAHLINLINP